MKRTVLINLICSFITVLVIALGVLFAITFNDSSIFSKPKLVISSESSTAVYDGKPLTNSKWHLASGELKNGHKLYVDVSGVQTDVGISENYVFATVKDSSGNDVSEEYDIEYLTGALNVKARHITVVAGSDEKVYDGTPLTCDDFFVSSAIDLAPGHTLKVTTEGSITEIGQTDNRITSAAVENQYGTDVTRNYSIKTETGTLTVYEYDDNGGDDIPGGGGDDIPGGGGDDTPGGGGDFVFPGADLGGGSNNSDTVLFTIVASRSGDMYLKMQSYGDYVPLGGTFLDAPEYGQLIDNFRSAYYLPAYALQNGGLTTHTVTIDSKYDIFVLPYYTTGNASLQTSDVVAEGNASSPYTVEYYNWTGTAGVRVPSKYNDYEDAYRQYVNDNYLYIDSETEAYMDGIIAANSFTSADSNIIGKVSRYIKNAAEYNLDYDTAMDSESNPVIAFLSEYKEGVCRHYAAAATMLFRALGIPARYTVGFLAEAKSGESVNVTAKNAHAWVEVYVDNIGWVNVEVTGSPSTSEIIALNIKPTDIRVLYTEGAVLNAGNTVSGFNVEGYTYRAEISGSVEGLGQAESVITEFEIYSADGTLVYKKSTGLGSDKFRITYKNGILHQYLSKVTFKSEGSSKIYDGIPLLTDINGCEFVSGDIHSELGYSYVIDVTGNLNVVGKVAATFEVSFFKDGVDCTDHFWINYNYGMLVLSAKEITISAGSAEKEYDGTALVCDSIIYDASMLAPTDHIEEYVVAGSQLGIGESSNVLKSVKIVNTDNVDVTANYEITIQDGLLIVTEPTT